jgi:hypothetical protein
MAACIVCYYTKLILLVFIIGSFVVQNIFVYVIGDWGRIVLRFEVEDFEELLKNYSTRDDVRTGAIHEDLLFSKLFEHGCRVRTM